MINEIKKLTATALFISLVCVGTLAIRIPVPATNGYIHLGDSMIYLVSLLFGPWMGMVASGIGSAFADIFGGYSHWALFTLIIKALEGLIIGGLGNTEQKEILSIRNIFVILLGGLWMVTGYYFCGVIMRGSWLIPLDSIPWNVIQAAGGAVLAIPAIYALNKSTYFQNWRKEL